MSEQQLPKYVAKYFWGDDISNLNLENNENYILQTLLNLGDQKAIRWLFEKTNKNHIKKKMHKLKLDSKSANFWEKYLS